MYSSYHGSHQARALEGLSGYQRAIDLDLTYLALPGYQ